MTSTLVDIDASPSLEHLLDIRIEFDPPQIFATPIGARLTYVIKRGRCQGPRITGDVLPGGGDWILYGTDGVARLDVRATVRTDDGALPTSPAPAASRWAPKPPDASPPESSSATTS